MGTHHRSWLGGRGVREAGQGLGGGWGTHRSWPGGRGGRPRALIPGEGKGSGRGARASVPGAPGTEQISQRVSYFCCF